jgi:hypothetical protein
MAKTTEETPNKNRKVIATKNMIGLAFIVCPPKTKKRDNSTESSRLVSLLNGFQVVRMMELLRAFGMCGVYQTMVLSISKNNT